MRKVSDDQRGSWFIENGVEGLFVARFKLFRCFLVRIVFSQPGHAFRGGEIKNIRCDGGGLLRPDQIA